MQRPSWKRKDAVVCPDLDNIPLIADEEYAKASPFSALIAPGVMAFMSVWAKYLEVDFFRDTPRTPASNRQAPMLEFVKEAFLMEREHQKLVGLECKVTVAAQIRG